GGGRAHSVRSSANVRRNRPTLSSSLRRFVRHPSRLLALPVGPPAASRWILPSLVAATSRRAWRRPQRAAVRGCETHHPYTATRAPPPSLTRESSSWLSFAALASLPG